MNTYRRVRKWTLFASCLASLGLSAYAQDENDLIGFDEDVYELSPFEITSGNDQGYDAQSTLSGTRFNTSVKDVGATMTILTEQFMDDVAMTNSNDLILFTPGAEKQTTQAAGSNAGGFASSLYYGDQTRFRGVHTENIVRNQFRTNMPSDSYNAGRFEVSRGSNSILFGIGNPAGLVNRYTNDAIFSDEYRIRNRLTDHGGVRNELSINKVLIKDKLAVRVAGLCDRDESWIKPLYQDQDRVYASIVYKPIEKLTIKLRGEYMNWDRSSAQYAVSLDGVTPYLNAAEASGHSAEENGSIWNMDIVPFESGGIRNYGDAMYNNFVFEDSTSQGDFQNWRNKIIGAERHVLESNTVSLPIDFVPCDFNIGGHGNQQHFDGHNIQAVVQYNVNDFIDLEYAYNDEDMLYDFVNNWNASRLEIDASSTLGDGVTPNPNVGRYFVRNDVNWRSHQNRYLTDHRFSVSLKYDFTTRHPQVGWLGNHNVAMMVENHQEHNVWDGMQLVNTTPLPGYPEGLWNPYWWPNNGIRIINYIDLDEQKIYGVHNPWDFKDTVNGANIPGVHAEWVPTTGAVGGGNHTLTEYDTRLIVIQSRFWDDRIVTTLGWREDDMEFAASGQPPQDPNQRGGVAMWAKDMERVRDDVQSALSPDTLSRGIVFHAYRGAGIVSDLSVYYNYSDSFGENSYHTLPDNSPFPNRTGESTDYGIKFGLFDSKVNGVFTVFESSIFNQNVSSSINYNDLTLLQELIGEEPLESISVIRDSEDMVSKGWEFQLSANITKNWRLMASVDHYKTIRSNVANTTGRIIDENRSRWLSDPDAMILDETGTMESAQDIFVDLNTEYLRLKAQEGARTMNERRNKVTIVSSYNFSDGAFKGLGFGCDYIWQDEASTGYALKHLDGGDWVPDPEKPFFTGDIHRFGAHIRYRRKVFNNIEWTIQLNVRNITEVDPYVIRHGATVENPNTPVPQLINRGEPRTYILSNTFKF